MLSNTLTKIRNVKCRDLLPRQQTKIVSKTLISSNCYLQRFIKFDDIGIFQSYSEFLHAALLESDPEVTSFTPQPYLLHINKKKYIPDCYFVKSGKRHIVELKPNAEFSAELHKPLVEFFQFHDIKFHVISNESILENEQLALNWLQIIRVLLSASEIESDVEELKLWEEFHHRPKRTIGDLIDIGDRIKRCNREIALYRLIHKGKLAANFDENRLGLDTEVSICS